MRTMNASTAHDHAVSLLEANRQEAHRIAHQAFEAGRIVERATYDNTVAAVHARLAKAADAYNALPAERPADDVGAKAHDAVIAEHVAARQAADALPGAPDHRALRDKLGAALAAADRQFNAAVATLAD